MRLEAVERREDGGREGGKESEGGREGERERGMEGGRGGREGGKEGGREGALTVFAHAFDDPVTFAQTEIYDWHLLFKCNSGIF